ncbi:hypothetical protein PilKf_02597 [Pillotina sp. SPG140]|jgi:hypothetical protein
MLFCVFCAGWAFGSVLTRTTINRKLIDGGFLNSSGVAGIEHTLAERTATIAGIYEDVGVSTAIVTKELADSQSTIADVRTAVDRAYNYAETTSNRISKLIQLLGIIRNRISEIEN